MKVSLNCDMGESFGLWRLGNDEAILPSVDCANVACGFHASDPWTMLKTVDLALKYGKQVGAHPSLPDKEGFGRREMKLRPEELKAAFIYQIGALSGFLKARGMAMSHVKPHGIIYGMAARDMETACAIAEAVAVFGVPLFGMAGTCHEKAAQAVGVEFIGEFFADLGYEPSGALIIPRVHARVDIDTAARRLKLALETGKVAAVDGTPIDMKFSTVCVHSDPPNSVEVATAMRAVLDAHHRG